MEAEWRIQKVETREDVIPMSRATDDVPQREVRRGISVPRRRGVTQRLRGAERRFLFAL